MTNHPSSTSKPVKETFDLFFRYYNEIDRYLDKLNFLVQAIPDEDYSIGIAMIVEVLEDISESQEVYMKTLCVRGGQTELIRKSNPPFPYPFPTQNMNG
jgi:hypothetical protein